MATCIFKIIRPANVYGPRSSFWTVALLMMIKAGKLKLIDDGRGMSNHVYIDNLVDAILLAAQNEMAPGESFIISDGVKTPWKDFLGYYTRMLGREPLPSISKARAWLTGLLLEGASQMTGKAPSLSRRAVGFWTQNGTYIITKARTMLGYSPRKTLDEGMKRTEKRVMRGDAGSDHRRFKSPRWNTPMRLITSDSTSLISTVKEEGDGY